MSQFTPRRFHPTPPQSHEKAPEENPGAFPRSYPQEHDGPVYAKRHQETQRIKNLSFWKNSDQDGGEEEEWPERQSLTPFILAVVILVVASALLWFLFQWASSENTNTPLVIAADTTPFKVRPENPGGMKIPHQDKLIYGRFSQNAPQPMERLLPPPEQPMAAPSQQQPLPQQPQFEPSPQQHPYYSQGQTYAPAPQGYPPPPSLEQGMPQQPQFQQPAPYPSFQGQTPYAQQPPQPHQPAYAPAPQSPYGPPTRPPSAASAPSSHLKPSTVEDIKPASDEEEGDGPIPSEGYNELDRLIAKEAQTPLKRATKKDTGKIAKLKPLDAGKHKVQIASLSSRSLAEQKMKRLRMRYGPIFENKTWNIQKINLGEDRGITHRLLVGPFSNHAAAAKFCKKLRSEKMKCLVVAPTHE